MQEKSKRIAKNTLFLYIRSFISLVIGLYTGRVQLEALGIDNYGINNVVGGIISFSSLLTGTMAAASSRYITYSLGEGVLSKMKNIFSTIVNIQVLMGIIAVVFLEIIGVWFLNTTAEIPAGRMFAANWVLQCSVITVFINLVAVPFNASIIAHEHMGVFAYMSIIEQIIRLLICFAILKYAGDRLILFSSLWLIATVLFNVFYACYCFKKFDEVKYERKIDKALSKELFQYSGWNLLSNTTWMFNTQGVNMLINVFFGVAFNAARGVAITVNSAAQTFISNFKTAMNPQIVKSYAAENYEYCYKLVNKGSKYTWYLTLIFLVPMVVEAKMLLSIWLVEVPPMAVVFLQFSMFESLSLQYCSNLLLLIQATGKVRRYTIEVSIYSAFVFPLTWIAYKLGAPVWISYPIFIFIYSTLLIFRLKTLTRLTTYNWRSFMSDVIKPCLTVTAVSFLIPLFISYFYPDSLLRFFILVPLSIVCTLFSIYIVGLNNNERLMCRNYISKMVAKFGIINEKND